MMKSILVRRRHLVVATFGIFAALFFLTTPVLAAETPPAAPAAPPAIPDLTPEQKVARAEALSAAASIKATQALANGDLALAQDARTLACEAANLISGVADFAADTGNTELAQSALNASIGVGEALGVIVGAAEMIRGTSDDPDTVAAANALAPAATLCQSTNSTAQETAVAAGASMAAAEEAYEPPGAGPPDARAFARRPCASWGRCAPVERLSDSWRWPRPSPSSIWTRRFHPCPSHNPDPSPG